MNEKVERILATYCGLGYHLFPVKKDTKKPAIKDNLQQASTDIDQLKKWSKKFPGCHWAISLAKSGLVAVDVDHKHGGMEAWDALIQHNGEPETLRAISGSGGKHYVFEADKTLKYRGQIQKGIDVKYNGYVLVYPSRHETTGRFYKWKNWGARPGKPEDWLLDLIKKDSRTGKADPTFRFGSGYLDKLVEKLRTYELDYAEWVQAGMAIHAATEGSPEGLRLYLELTQGPSFQDGDLELAENKWDSFSETSDGITELTLGFLIRKKGGVVPNPQYEEDIKAFKEAKIAEIEAEKKDQKGFYIHGEKMICWKVGEIVDHFNRKGFVFIRSGGKAPFAKLRRSKSGAVEIVTMGEKALADLTAPYSFAKYRDSGNDVKVELTPAYKEWMGSINRKEYDRIVFKPEAEAGELNLWSEIAMEPIHNSEPTIITRFILDSLCNGDVRKFNWLLDWLAHIVQKPAERCSVVPVLISEQGAGKGLLMDHIMARVLGDFFTVVETSAELMEKFNVKLTKKFLTFIDESTWRGNKTEDGRLKRLTGSPTMTVEEKFGAKYDLENYSRYFIASNNEEAVALENGNRRYVVIEASKKYLADESYWDPIAEAVRADERVVRAFYGFLLDRDLKRADSDFHPHRILKGNTAGKTAKINTGGAVAQFWEDLFFQNPKKLWIEGKGLDCSLAYREFLRFCSEIKTYEKSITASGFWAKTTKMIPDLPDAIRRRWGENSERIRVRRVDVTPMCQKFCEKMAIDPPEDLDEADFIAESYLTDEEEFDFD